MASHLSRDGSHSRSFQVMMDGLERMFSFMQEVTSTQKQ